MKPAIPFLLALLLASPAQAVAIYTEIGDAGGTVATAQDITDANTRTIIGEILNQADPDMFGFNWPTSGNFTIDALIPSTLHRTLALYDPSGVFVAGSVALAGMIVSNLVAGDYYLYIEGDPQNYRLEINNAIIPIAREAAVPAPAPLPLVVTGLAFIALLSRRKAARSAPLPL